MVHLAHLMARRRRRAVSRIMSALLLTALAIAAAALAIIYMNKQTKILTQISSVDTGESRILINPTTGTGTLLFVFMNTGTTTLTLWWGRIGLQGLAYVSFPAKAQIIYGASAADGAVTTSDQKASGITTEGLVLASQTSATVKFTDLPNLATLIPPNVEYAVTIYTTGSEVLTFKLVAEASGA